MQSELSTLELEVEVQVLLETVIRVPPGRESEDGHAIRVEPPHAIKSKVREPELLERGRREVLSAYNGAVRAMGHLQYGGVEVHARRTDGRPLRA